MEVHLNPDVEAKLSRLADARGSNAEMLAIEAIERFVVYDEWFIAEVEKGLTQIERDKTLSHEEVGLRMESLIAGRPSRQ